MELEFYGQFLDKQKYTKFHENLSVTAQLFDAETWTDRETDRRTDVTQLTVA
jgi:hypothetical protein